MAVQINRVIYKDLTETSGRGVITEHLLPSGHTRGNPKRFPDLESAESFLKGIGYVNVTNEVEILSALGLYHTHSWDISYWRKTYA